jgi:hypothetical protein
MTRNGDDHLHQLHMGARSTAGSLLERDAELDRLAPGPSRDLDGARAVLEDFGRFWTDETDPEPRRELLQQLFDRVWVDGQKIVAVRPTSAFAALFTGGAVTGQRGVKSGSDGGQTRMTHPCGIEVRLGLLGARRLTRTVRLGRIASRRRPVAKLWNVRSSRGSRGEGNSPSRS